MSQKRKDGSYLSLDLMKRVALYMLNYITDSGRNLNNVENEILFSRRLSKCINDYDGKASTFTYLTWQCALHLVYLACQDEYLEKNGIQKYIEKDVEYWKLQKEIQSPTLIVSANKKVS